MSIFALSDSSHTIGRKGEHEGRINPVPHLRDASEQTRHDWGSSFKNICSVWQVLKLCTSIVTFNKKTPTSPLEAQKACKAAFPWCPGATRHPKKVPWVSHRLGAFRATGALHILSTRQVFTSGNSNLGLAVSTLPLLYNAQDHIHCCCHNSYPEESEPSKFGLHWANLSDCSI